MTLITRTLRQTLCTICDWQSSTDYPDTFKEPKSCGNPDCPSHKKPELIIGKEYYITSKDREYGSCLEDGNYILTGIMNGEFYVYKGLTAYSLPWGNFAPTGGGLIRLTKEEVAEISKWRRSNLFILSGDVLEVIGKQARALK